jgi:hypothetical protein
LRAFVVLASLLTQALSEGEGFKSFSFGEGFRMRVYLLLYIKQY